MKAIHHQTQNIKTMTEKLQIRWQAYLILLLIFTASCGQEQETTEIPEATGDGSGEVVLTGGQIELAGFEFGKVESKLLSGDVEARGKLMLPQDGQATISPVISGVLHSIEVMPGQPVEQGSVLAYLSHPDYIELQEQYLSVANNLIFLENEYQRQKRLFEENVSSEKKYLQTKTEFQGAKAKLNALELMIEQLGLNPAKIQKGEIFSKIPVKSPIRGMVDAINVKLGQNVQDGTPMFKITCRDKLLVSLDVFEKDIRKIEKGQRVTFVLSNVGDQVYEATVISVGGSVQNPGRIVKVLASFENKGYNLFPGMFVASQIHTGEEYFEALPVSAIMNYGTGKPFIYYTTDPSGSNKMSFSRATVETGYEETGYIRVNFTDPLPENTLIVTKGGYYIQAEEGKASDG